MIILLKLEYMDNVTISKKEYRKLFEKAMRYEYLHQLMTEDIFASPPTKNIKEMIREFRATKRYTSKFLNNLEKGLKRSSYFK